MGLSPKKRKKLNPKDRVTKSGRVLTQAYAQLFPDPADRMYWLRDALNMTQEQIAAECGVSSGVFSTIECGYGLPKGTTLIKIATGLNVSADYILNLSSKKEITK